MRQVIVAGDVAIIGGSGLALEYRVDIDVKVGLEKSVGDIAPLL